MPACRLALVALLVMAVTLSSAPLPFIRDGSKADLGSMQGEWVAVSCRCWYIHEDTGLPERVERHDIRLKVEGRRLEFTQDGKARLSYGFRLDGSKGLGRIDTRRLDRAGWPHDWGEGAGVYKVEGDTLTICDGPEGARPEGFTGGTPGMRIRLMVLKRVKVSRP